MLRVNGLRWNSKEGGGVAEKSNRIPPPNPMIYIFKVTQRRRYIIDELLKVIYISCVL